MSFRSSPRLSFPGPTLLLCLACLGCLGCGARPERLPFAAGAGQAQWLRPGRGPGTDGWYGLRRPVTVGSAGRALYLRYRGDPGGAELVVYASTGRNPPAGERAVARRPLPSPPPGAEAVVYLPLPAGTTVGGIAVGAAGGEPGGEPVGLTGPQLLAAGLGSEVRGLELAGSVLHVGAEVAAFRETPSGFELSLAPGALPAASGGLEGRWQIIVEYTSHAAPAWADWKRREAAAEPAARPPRVEARVDLESGARLAAFVHRGVEGARRLALPGPLAGFDPRRLGLSAALGGSLRLERLEIRPIGGGAGGIGAAEQPIAADPGAILLYPQERWRGKQYELFAWTRFPEILIMDTASYAVQSRFFKRLAFYVEKGGYRGRLLANEEFAGLHGYNAHDYRAEDLARFFSEARRQRFPLNPEEELLARILVANGVLREGIDYEPGRGGILSVSRSSSALLRRHLLTHECCHGLFFVLPEYRAEAFREWQALPAAERSFYELFFTWVGYDVDDPYLAANEYQAYLFQQERAGVDSYFRDLTAPRLLARYPRAEAGILGVLAQSPSVFAAGFDRLEPWLVRQAGVEGGRVIELLPADSNR